ncbi:MAG: U32 family peptidase [Erysipelotrichaceae bacterium]
MKKIELLSPAGDLERLKTAVRYGADAVYIGGKQFSLRSRASNFSIEEIEEGVKFATSYGANVHVTMNILPHVDELAELVPYIKALEKAKVKAIIVASAYIASVAKEVAPNLEVHISTQNSSTNSSVAKFWESKGMDRVVIAREATLDEIRATTSNTDMPIEVFIHGGMCVSYSGRCTLSNHMTNRDANRGGCAQSCRWKYKLYNDNELISKQDELFSMSSKDLMAAKYIPDLIDANVASLKIEGRMKTNYYIATVVSTYRALIDEYYESGQLSEERLDYYTQQLRKAENRPTSSGFYEGLPNSDAHLYGVNGAGVTQEFIATVLGYDEVTKLATIQVRNNFSSGMECEIFGPHRLATSFIMPNLTTKDGESIALANKPMQILQANLGFEVYEHEMIRKIKEK